LDEQFVHSQRVFEKSMTGCVDFEGFESFGVERPVKMTVGFVKTTWYSFPKLIPRDNLMSVKVAIIGAGGMLQYHAAGFQESGAEVVAVVDRDAETGQATAEKWAIPQAYTSTQQMLAEADVDAVSVIVPNKYHAPLAIECLRAGKHVFCEKPPALNAAQVQQMIEVAEATGKTLMFNYNNRARPESYKIKELIDAGEVGTINSAQAKWIRRTGIPGFGGWFTTKELSGGGPLIDLLHMVDLALYFMGYPEPAHVLGQTFDTFIDDKTFKGPWGIPDQADGVTDVEAAAHGFVTFKTGQVLSLQVSWAEMVKREEVSVVFQGTKAGGKIERLFGSDGEDDTAIDSLEFYTHIDGQPGDQKLEVAECEDMGRQRSAANFIATLEGKEQPLNVPSQSLALMKVIDALYESAASGKPVSMD
jgi:predicted dehydrogenase